MSDEEVGAAHEPMALVGEHFPASWEARPSWFGLTADELASRVAGDPALAVAALLASDTEVGILRSALADARTEVGGLRLRIAAMELTYRAALADAGGPKFDGPNWRDDPLEKTPIVRGYTRPNVLPLHRALTVRPGAFGLRVGMEG